MHELVLFAGAGGGILGAILDGENVVCAVELDDYARACLLARQNDGCLTPFPVWNDVRSFTARNNACRRAFRQLRRLRNSLRISGGFPCQDISVAGFGEGLEGARSGLWKEFLRIIGEIRPVDVLIENSPALTLRGGVRVIADLAALGYDCRWGIVSAADAIWLDGPPCLDHLRERIWIAGTRADTEENRRPQRDGEHERRLLDPQDGEGRRNEPAGICADDEPETPAGPSGTHPSGIGREFPGAERNQGGRAMPERRGAESANSHSDRIRQQPEPECRSSSTTFSGPTREAHPDADGAGLKKQRSCLANGTEHEAAQRGGWWAAESAVGRMAARLAHRVDRLSCTGNGQVPRTVALAKRILTVFTDQPKTTKHESTHVS